MAGRLREVQRAIRRVLDILPPGPIRVVSGCSGDGRDLLGALVAHPRARDVTARLVDLTPELVRRGRRRAHRAGLTNVRFVLGDASIADAYMGAVPADLVLFCGIFGNISDADVHRSIRHLPELCAEGATVIWTRGRFRPDLTPAIRAWFERAGFVERSFVTIPGSTKAVGVHRLARTPSPLRPGVRLFTFLPYARRPATLAGTRGRGRSGPGGDRPAATGSRGPESGPTTAQKRTPRGRNGTHGSPFFHGVRRPPNDGGGPSA